MELNINLKSKNEEYLDTKNNQISENELEEIKKQHVILELKSKLNNLSQDFIQVQCGAVFDDLEERKRKFRTLHNELRLLQNKKERSCEN